MSTIDPAAGSPTIAIVGSGPSGCYTAQFLRKAWRDSEIVMFDRLALPYGLVRYGVAPDHQGTKAVTKQFDRLFERDGVRFVENTEIGSDITLDALRASFDIVVLATGLPADRFLDGHRADMAGVFGAGVITRLINGHPEEDAESLVLGRAVTIVGHGNVALDLVRLFLTPAEELRELGVQDAVIDALGRGPVELIEIVGRSHAPSAKFDIAMAKELGKLADVRFLADGLISSMDDGDPDPRAAVIRDLVASSPEQASRVVHFRFGWVPDRLEGTDVVNSITFRSVDDAAELLEIPTHSICTAIGFAERDDAPLRRGDHETEATNLDLGLLDSGLYCVGWLRRGPQGTIPANRVDSRMVADEIVAAVESGALTPHKPGYANITSPTLIKEFS